MVTSVQRALMLVLVATILQHSDVQTSAKRVVHIPAPAISHVKYHTHVARALADLGHQVWVAMPSRLQAQGVLDTTNISVITFDLAKDYQSLMIGRLAGDYFSGGTFDISFVIELTLELNDAMLRHPFVEEIRELQPDLIVLENLPNTRMMTVLPYKLGVPFALLGSAYDFHGARIPISPAVSPFPIPQFPSTDNMTFLERVKSTLLYAVLTAYDPFCYRDLASIYAPEKPYIPNDMLISRAEIWLVEMDHILDYPRPTLPNVKLIGGTATGPARPLPPHLASFMDGATEGVVIVSFGSYVLGVPQDISRKLLAVFQQLPMKVVFRSNLTSPDPAKILTSSWLPQNDLLGHANTKVFVSHCGKNGQYEALYQAVPLLCMPLFADQPYNAERIRVKGFGEVLDLIQCSAEELLATIISVSSEPRYKRAISRASHLFRQQYGVPTLEAAKWLDHVMQYGGEYMRYAGQKIPRYQLLILDVLAFVFAVGAVTALLFYVCVRCLWRYCSKRKRKIE